LNGQKSDGETAQPNREIAMGKQPHVHGGLPFSQFPDDPNRHRRHHEH
jgi:hypothetical protein